MNITTEYLKSRKILEFIDTLRGKNVNLVIDVRYSATYPEWFNPKNLRMSLKQVGINYLNFQSLGNPPGFRTDKTYQESRKLYSEYILKNRRNEINAICSILQKQETHACLICYCKTEDPNLCHRFWLLDIMKKVEQEQENSDNETKIVQAKKED